MPSDSPAPEASGSSAPPRVASALLTQRLDLAGAAAAVGVATRAAAVAALEGMLLDASEADEEMAKATSALRTLLPWVCDVPGMVLAASWVH